jgi:phage tail sheath protein FI
MRRTCMPTYLSPGVYVEEVDSGARPIEGVGTAVAAFVGAAERGPADEPTLVTNWSQFSQVFGGFVEGSYLAHAVYGYFMNGGGSCYVVRVGANGSEPTAQAELGSGADGKLRGYRIAALEPGTAGNDLSVEVADGGEGAAEDTFRLIVKRGNKIEERFDGLTTKKGKQNAVSLVNAQSKLIQLEEAATGAALEKPVAATVSLAGGGAAAPERVTPEDYVGDSADRTGFGGLEAIDPVTMVCVPDLMAAYQAGVLDLEGVQAVQLAMIAHCELMGDRVAILDTPPGLNAQQVREWRVDKMGYDSKYAALYWPWVKVFGPGSGQNISVPPSGQVAGVWSRNDDTRGVHKAPANEVVRGAIALPQCPQALQLPGGVDPERHPVGGLRAQRPRPVGPDAAHDQRLPGQRVAQGRPLRAHTPGGVLRQV